MECEMEFRRLVSNIAESLTVENVATMRYLCRDAIQHSMKFEDALSFFDYFESKGWISIADMSFLAEVLYRINRHDLLKRLPNVKNRKEYELNFLNLQMTQNFTAFRIACFQLIDELTVSDFKTLKNFCRNILSKRNYEKSVDVISLLVCLEEEDHISDGDLSFILECLCHLDNQVPYTTFYRLSQGDNTIILPKVHQAIYLKSQSVPGRSNPLPKHPYKSDGHFDNASGEISFHPLSPGNQNVFTPNFDNSTQAKFFLGPPGQQPSGFVKNRTFSEEPDFNKPTIGMHASNFQLSRLLQTANHDDTVSKVPIEHETELAGTNEYTFMQAPLHENVIIPSDQQQYATNPSSSMHSNPSLFKDDAISQPLYVQLPEKVIDLDTEEIVDKTTQCPSLQDYPMCNKPTGICLVINNCNFDCHSESTSNIQLGNRKGSEIDCKKISSLFDCFGFDVKVHEDLNVENMKKTFQNISKLSHEKYDCFVLVIMSHGGRGCIYGVDKEILQLAEIKMYFKPDCCPTLSGKPKIFFIQACQSDVSNVAAAASDAASSDLELDGLCSGLVHTPSEADFLICYSTVPGYPSYRSRSHGSFFIKLLVENLVKHSKSNDLLSIMTQVNNQIAQQPLGQISMPISTLRCRIYLTLCKPFPDNLLLPN